MNICQRWTFWRALWNITVYNLYYGRNPSGGYPQNRENSLKFFPARKTVNLKNLENTGNLVFEILWVPCSRIVYPPEVIYSKIVQRKYYWNFGLKIWNLVHIIKETMCTKMSANSDNLVIMVCFQAVQAGLNDLREEEAWHWLKAEEWTRAHQLILKHLASQAIVNG